jgi:hypothetical protein
MSTTLLLDRDNWDLAIDAAGNIALASEPYSQVQDASSACRLFEGEAWYDTTLGVPYFAQVFRGGQPVQVLKARLALAAQSVPGVTAATVVLTELTARTLVGQLQLRLETGGTMVATL